MLLRYPKKGLLLIFQVNIKFAEDPSIGWPKHMGVILLESIAFQWVLVKRYNWSVFYRHQWNLVGFPCFRTDNALQHLKFGLAELFFHQTASKTCFYMELFSQLAKHKRGSSIGDIVQACSSQLAIQLTANMDFRQD